MRVGEPDECQLSSTVMGRDLSPCKLMMWAGGTIQYLLGLLGIPIQYGIRYVTDVFERDNFFP